VVVLLQELVFALDCLVDVQTWVHSEGGTTLLLCHNYECTETATVMHHHNYDRGGVCVCMESVCV